MLLGLTLFFLILLVYQVELTIAVDDSGQSAIVAAWPTEDPPKQRRYLVLVLLRKLVELLLDFLFTRLYYIAQFASRRRNVLLVALLESRVRLNVTSHRAGAHLQVDNGGR